MAYATYTDVEKRLDKQLSESERTLCTTLLDDAAVIIDAYNPCASEGARVIASCQMVIRAIKSAEDTSVPIGATQSTMSALGYSQSWSIPQGSIGELYLSKLEKKLLGVGNRIGAHSPLEDMQ